MRLDPSLTGCWTGTDPARGPRTHAVDVGCGVIALELRPLATPKAAKASKYGYLLIMIGVVTLLFFLVVCDGPSRVSRFWE